MHPVSATADASRPTFVTKSRRELRSTSVVIGPSIQRESWFRPDTSELRRAATATTHSCDCARVKSAPMAKCRNNVSCVSGCSPVRKRGPMLPRAADRGMLAQKERHVAEVQNVPRECFQDIVPDIAVQIVLRRRWYDGLEQYVGRV